MNNKQINKQKPNTKKAKPLPLTQSQNLSTVVVVLNN